MTLPLFRSGRIDVQTVGNGFLLQAERNGQVV